MTPAQEPAQFFDTVLQSPEGHPMPRLPLGFRPTGAAGPAQGARASAATLTTASPDWGKAASPDRGMAAAREGSKTVKSKQGRNSMRRNAMRSFSVAVGLSCSWALPALAGNPSVNLGSLECEAIHELKALVEKQQSILAWNKAYAGNLTDLLAAGYMPAACPDGSRVRVSGPDAVGGCHFTYGLVSVVNNPRTGDSTFEAVALGVAGTPSAGLEFYITRIVSRYHDFIESYMYDKGVYSDVDLNACSQAG